MDENHFWGAMLYVEQNPVRARWVEQAGEWRWSSAQAHLRGEDAGPNANGVYSFRRTATIVGQAEVLSISCQDTYYGGGRTLNTDYAVGYNDVYYNDHPTIWVRIGGDETGGGTGHGSTHYNRYMKLNPNLSDGPAYRLYYASTDYLAMHPEISRICMNDMGLSFGANSISIERGRRQTASMIGEPPQTLPPLERHNAPMRAALG